MEIRYFYGFIFYKIIMANSTRAELRADVRIELKKDPNAKVWSDEALNTYINKAYLKVQKDGNFQWRENQANTTFSTEVWIQEYSLPTDLAKIQLVRYEWTNLIKTTKVRLKREQSTFVSWTPSKYYIFGANVWFDVLPNWTWTVDFDYAKRLAAFTADTDTSELNVDFDLAIVKYAAFLAWSSIDGKQNTAQAQLQEYNLELDTLYSSYIFDDIQDLVYWLQRGNRYVTQANTLDR